MATFIPYSLNKGQENMDIDSQFLADSINRDKEPTLRLYGWKCPTLSIGRNQRLKGINVDFCHRNNIEIVQRPTGGRAILHQHELTYSFITSQKFLKNGLSIASSYHEISQALVIAFKKLGIDLEYPENKEVYLKNDYCMAISTGADLSYKGKKLIGSAQYRSNGYILQHGSIIVDIDNNLLSGIFDLKDIPISCTTIKEIDSKLCRIDVLSNAVKKGFETKFDVEFKEL